MKKQTDMTDERLDELLAAMSAEKSENSDGKLRPPVINEYRLEKERLRRQKRTQAVVVSIVAAISAIVTTVCGFILTKLYSMQIHELMRQIRRSEAYAYIEKFIEAYGGEMKIAFVSMLVLLAFCYALGAGLLVKNKDKILQSHQN